MLNLNDPIWSRLEDANRLPYDPVPALRKLERVNTPEDETKVFDELWNKLYSQGDVGTCSYACVPLLVHLMESRPPLTPDFFALVAVIEIGRMELRNPRIPRFIVGDYSHALGRIPAIIEKMPTGSWDHVMMGSVAAALAVSKGNHLLAQAYLEMTEDSVHGFLNQQAAVKVG